MSDKTLMRGAAPGPRAETPADTVETEMERVLRAERDAERAIARCRERAGETLEAARAHARDITRRTDARIDAVHARCAEATRKHLQALEREAAAMEASPTWDERDSERLQQAVERLAARLTTGERGESAG